MKEERMDGKKTLICKEDLLDTVLDHFGVDLAYLGKDLQFCQEAIAMAPAVDAEKVVHARWIRRGNEMRCSRKKCQFIYYSNKDDFNYCPNCGAKMEQRWRE